ncbi:hypothetical protein SC09_contig4orf00291 [Bacillus subtilis]|uniref:Uncharacterized protein n=1 Tax=Bacillus subtilis TaxID=1423 RepID=A0A0D1IZQ4_BACIU|nr:hypothetical protein SC09_contig4orf00291 [Bacillus subtilis]
MQPAKQQINYFGIYLNKKRRIWKDAVFVIIERSDQDEKPT